MAKENLRPVCDDRFNSVEAVATEIFKNMLDLDEKGQAPDAADVAASDPYTSNVMPLFGQKDGTAEPLPSQYERLWAALIQVLQDRNLAGLALLPQPEQRDTSAHAATPDATSANSGHQPPRRRPQLLNGIEPLTSKPNILSEDEMLHSIREMVGEQERERHLVAVAEKRVVSRQKLPPLEPEASDAASNARGPRDVSKPSFLRKARLRLKRAFERDLFLAACLSVWFSLTLMVFIDPALSTELSKISLFLLFVAFCLSASDPTRRPESVEVDA